MAVYTRLDEAFAKVMLSLYPDAGRLEGLEGIAQGSINTSYRVRTSTGELFLRVNENKAFSDLVYEKNLLVFLEASQHRLGDVKTPRMLQNSVRGYFFPVAPPGEMEPAKRLPADTKYACLFEALAGRELAVFEIAKDHVEQVGTFLARAHRTLRRFRGGRQNPYGAPVLLAWLEGLRHVGLPPPLVRRLDRSLSLALSRRRALPRGVIHGDLFPNNTKWSRGRLHAVIDWEMAGRDHLALDLAITLCAWCWRRDLGAFDEALCRALLRGYTAVRPLAPSEQRGFFEEARLAALRFTLSRIRDFGTSATPAAVVSVFSTRKQRDAEPAPAPERDFLDYREYEARLDAIEAMGRRGLAKLCGVA